MTLARMAQDTSAPTATIDSGPGETTDDPTPTIAFSADEPVTFDYRIFGQGRTAPAFSACSGPGATHTPSSALANGDYTFEVRATDESANFHIAARDFTVDAPVGKAKIGKVSVKGPSKVRKGKKATYRVKVSNSGNIDATGVKLKVKGKGVRLKTSVGKVAAGKTRTVKLKLKPKKPGKVKLTFKVTSSNAGGKSTKKKITVKK
jgi:hypothetical protein